MLSPYFVGACYFFADFRFLFSPSGFSKSKSNKNGLLILAPTNFKLLHHLSSHCWIRIRGKSHPPVIANLDLQNWCSNRGTTNRNAVLSCLYLRTFTHPRHIDWCPNIFHIHRVSLPRDIERSPATRLGETISSVVQNL